MRVYLDNAATTPVAKEVIEVMNEVLHNTFGNPSSTHYAGRQAKAILENSRRLIAGKINCKPSEIIFTSGGTEADNMALHCAVRELKVKRIITSTIEHHAVGHTAESLKCEDLELIYLDIDSKGNVDLNQLEKLLQDGKKTLVSLMHANNEIGTLLPIKEVACLCKKYNAFFHSDTVQTMGHYPFDLQDLQIDFVTCAAHKFHGPKGIGFLYVNGKNSISSLLKGGAQERGLRGGTENISGIAGFAKAMELAYEDIAEHQKYVQELKNYMVQILKEKLKDISFHGEMDADKSLYTVLNVCLPKTEKASMLLFSLDLKGIACSGGSACSSGAAKGSHVLDGIRADMTRPNVRFSFSRFTTKQEIEYAVEQLIALYNKVLV